MVISKSEYMMFLKHPAWLWLKKFDKKKIPEPDANLQALFDEGALFEEYAERLFPDAVKLGYKNGNEFSGTKYYALPQTTQQEIDKGTRVIFQGRLEVDLPVGSITSIFDVLERVEGDEFDLYEIKSSTSAKPEHISDLAFQTIVLERAGLKLRKIYVLHVNNKYIRDGEIDPEGITTKSEVTEEVRGAIDETLYNIGKAFEVLAKKEMPDVSPKLLQNCGLDEWLPIFKAVRGEFPDHSIYDLCRLSPDTVGKLEDLGIENIADIPLDFELSAYQERQTSAVRSGEQSIDVEKIEEFINELEYPLHFFDYETVAGVIPAFDGTRPYQQVPFQYSLHIQHERGGELVHKEYLHEDNTYPVLPLIKQMIEDFEGKGSIVSWNKRFEVGRNNEMAEMHPKYANFLHNLNDRMVDLMIPFSSGWFVDKEFYGSASLKAVLPVLVPELSYKTLEVQHGGQAQRVWIETVLGGKNTEKKAEIMEHLRQYCTLDTYSMYAVLEYLTKRLSRDARV